MPHGSSAASGWVRRWSHLYKPGQTVLDVACGAGRHMAWFSAQGLLATGIDRSETALAQARAHGHVVLADIENHPWPLQGPDGAQTFDVVVVTNYLWRALLPTIINSVAPGGLLVYETFALGNQAFGKPSNPDFLLRDGELLSACQGMTILGFEQGLLREPPRCVQRIAACKPTTSDLGPAGQAHWLE